MPQFLIERGRMNRDILIPKSRVHHLILLDKILLKHLDDFHGDNQRDRNHCIEQDKIGEEDKKTIKMYAKIRPVDVIFRSRHLVVASEDRVCNPSEKTDQYLET